MHTAHAVCRLCTQWDEQVAHQLCRVGVGHVDHQVDLAVTQVVEDARWIGRPGRLRRVRVIEQRRMNVMPLEKRVRLLRRKDREAQLAQRENPVHKLWQVPLL